MIEHSTLGVWEYRYMVRSNREMNYLLGNTIHAMMQINRAAGRERERERERKRNKERERNTLNSPCPPAHLNRGLSISGIERERKIYLEREREYRQIERTKQRETKRERERNTMNSPCPPAHLNRGLCISGIGLNPSTKHCSLLGDTGRPLHF